MIVYVFLIALTLIFHFKFYKKENIVEKKYAFNFLMVLYTLVSAIRYNVGTDYLATYTTVFGWLKNGVNYNYEYLFLLLNKFVILIHGNATLLLSICAIITIPLFFNFIKKYVDHKYWFFSIFIFIGSTMYYATMNVVRQYIAIALIIFAYKYLKEKKYLLYILINIIACLFHTSAVVNILFLICYYIYIKKHFNWCFYFIYIISLITIVIDARFLLNNFSFLLPSRYITYLSSQFVTDKNTLAVLKIIVPNVLLILMNKYKNVLKKNNSNFDYTFVGWFLYVIITNMGFGVNVLIRIGFYFEYFLLIIIPMVIDYYNSSKNKITKSGDVLILFFIVYYIFLNVYSIFIKNGHGVIPYHTIWS
jgi:hypothetical protein